MRLFTTIYADGSIRSAEIVLPLVFEWFGSPDSVIDVGCGVGSWLSVCSSLGVPNITGIDGDYVKKEQLRIPIESFMSADLNRPPAIKERSDMAMSLEVAEHLPAESAKQFVRYLVSLSEKILENDQRMRLETERFSQQRLMLVYDNIITREPVIRDALKILYNSVIRFVMSRLKLGKVKLISWL